MTNTDKKQNGLVHITSTEQLNNIIKTTKIVIIDFSADWCGPCRKLGELLEAEFQSFVDEHDDVKLVKVNTDEFRNYIKKFKIKGIPMLMIFKNGKLQEYEIENRKKGQIVKEISNRITGFRKNMPELLKTLISNLLDN